MAGVPAASACRRSSEGCQRRRAISQCFPTRAGALSCRARYCSSLQMQRRRGAGGAQFYTDSGFSRQFVNIVPGSKSPSRETRWSAASACKNTARRAIGRSDEEAATSERCKSAVQWPTSKVERVVEYRLAADSGRPRGEKDKKKRERKAKQQRSEYMYIYTCSESAEKGCSKFYHGITCQARVIALGSGVQGRIDQPENPFISHLR